MLVLSVAELWIKKQQMEALVEVLAWRVGVGVDLSIQ
jgi:hypothetical protein